MACSLVLLAKRASVRVLISVALAYGMALTINRDSTDQELRTAYRRLFLRAHPDEGGSAQHAQRCGPKIAQRRSKRFSRFAGSVSVCVRASV